MFGIYARNLTRHYTVKQSDQKKVVTPKVSPCLFWRSSLSLFLAFLASTNPTSFRGKSHLHSCVYCVGAICLEHQPVRSVLWVLSLCCTRLPYPDTIALATLLALAGIICKSQLEDFPFPDDFEPSDNASDDEETIEKEEEEADGDDVSHFVFCLFALLYMHTSHSLDTFKMLLPFGKLLRGKSHLHSYGCCVGAICLEHQPVRSVLRVPGLCCTWLPYPDTSQFHLNGLDQN